MNDGWRRCIRSIASIGIAKIMGMETIAEGVEQKDYIDFLKQEGCDMVQGFYYYKPMPVDEFLSLLAVQRKKQRKL